MLDQSIFKSYDVRGTYPNQLNREAAYRVGRAFIRRTGAKAVVVGHDARISSPELFLGLAEGMASMGAKIHDIGMVPTECLYFAVGKYEYSAGVMITASHNPKEYNGCKMLVKEAGQIHMVRGKDLLASLDDEPMVAGQPEIKKEDIWADFSNYVLPFVDLTRIVPMKIVVDASNGVAGLALEKMKDRIPVEIIPMNFGPDGNFPNHSPNPLEKGSSEAIGKAIAEHQADFGIMFDGDADRIFLVDEAGTLVSADITLLLLAKYFLQKSPGMGIAYNAICSKAVAEFVNQWGGIPVRTKVGFVNVREGLMQNNGIMGGELSAHYCFKDNWYMDSGMIAFLTLLHIISTDGRKVSEMAKELSPYFKSAEDNFTVADKDAVLEKVKEQYADGSQDFLDGVTVSYQDWWFNVRPSNTEPLLRLTVEANTRELLADKQKELAIFIKAA